MGWVYYNDVDAEVCAWLRELIAMGELPAGEVDERSILDVSAGDLRGFSQCHFFAGIGGWAEALRLARVPEDVSVWTGSPPCQPFSIAGKGLARDDARHLSPHFLGLVRTGRPSLLFGEQVDSSEVFGPAARPTRRGLAKAPVWAWLDDLFERLEAARYASGASDLPAAGAGSPQKRQRCFFGAIDRDRLAGSDGRVAGGLRALQSGRQHGFEPRDGGAGVGLVYGERAGLERLGGDGAGIGQSGRLGAPSAGPSAAAGSAGRLADDAGAGWGQEPADRRRLGSGNGAQGRAAGSAAGGFSGGVADRDGDGRREGFAFGAAGHDGSVRDGAAGDLFGHNSKGACPDHGFWADPDWLLCRDGFLRPVESAVLGVVDGLPGCVVPGGAFVPASFPLAPKHKAARRRMRLKGYGNSIVPAVAAEFIEAFLEAVL